MPQGLKALKNRLLPRRKRPQPDQTDTPPGPASPTPASPSVSQLNIADAQDASIPQDLWQDAYNQLDLSEQHILSTVPVPTQLGSKNGGGSTIETILEGVIQTTKEQYERYQNRSFKIRRSTGEDIDLRKLSHKIIDAALSFKNIIDAVVASDPTHHAASAWAVVSLGLTMTKNHFDMQDALFDSSEYLANALARYACIEKQVYPNSTKKAEIRDAIVKVYTAILRYTAEASSAQISSAKRHILNSVVVIAGQPLEKLKKSVEAEELRLHQWIQLDHLLQHREKAESILAKIDEAFACLQSLVKTFSLPIAKGASYDSYMDQHESLCLPETRVELQGQISKWAESPHSKCIFWLNGMAGTGKSTIARTVAHAFDMRGQLGASFFFKKGEADRGNAERFISTITKQLIARNQQLANEVFKVIKKDADIATRSLKLQFDKLILQPLLNLDPHPQQATVLLIVIDALDECEQEKEIQNILQLLPQLQEAKSVRLQVFLTSRPELPIRLGFQQIMDHQDLVLHDLPHSVIEHDIRVFLKVELEKIRKDRLPSSDWPGNDAIDKLVIMAFPLFIFASTVCRFIGDRKWRPEKRLAAVLQDKAAGSMSEMDRTYLPVLTHLLAGDNESMSKELVREFQDIIGVIILLATPLSVASLAQLIKQEEDDISNRLDAFHSVLSISDDIHTPVRILHLSFRDFLVNTTSEFRVDEKETHQKIASFCLRVMNSGLKHNICSFSSYGTQRIDIDHDVIAHHLPPDLQYACHYWVYHLQQSKDHASHVEVFTFLQDHFLHWLEAMSLMGLVSETVSMIDILQSKIGTRTNTEFSEFLHDARRFILQNVYMCNAFPLQLYCSGLAFSPMCSVTRKLFQKSQRRLHILPQVESSWSAELQTLEGHSDGVQSVVFSADGQMLASGSDDHTIKLWDTKTGSEIRTLEGHSNWVRSVAFSADGQMVASGSADYTIKLWDTKTGSEIRTLEGHSDRVRSVAFSADGQMVASGSDDHTIKLWDTKTGSEIRTLEGHSSWVHSVVFSADGQMVASGSDDHTIKLWDTKTGSEIRTLEGHSDGVQSVVFSADGQMVASGSADYTIKLWDTKTGSEIRTLEGHSSWVRSVAFSADGQMVASGSDDQTIKLWDTKTGSEIRTLEGHSSWVRSVAFSADGQMVASGSDDHTIKLWDTKTGSEIRTLEGHSSWVQSVVFSADGQDGQPVGPSFQISVDNDWVSFAGERILWLPVKYRPFSCSIIQNDTLCLGYANGRVSIMGFHAPVA